MPEPATKHPNIVEIVSARKPEFEKHNQRILDRLVPTMRKILEDINPLATFRRPTVMIVSSADQDSQILQFAKADYIRGENLIRVGLSPNADLSRFEPLIAHEMGHAVLQQAGLYKRDSGNRPNNNMMAFDEAAASAVGVFAIRERSGNKPSNAIVAADIVLRILDRQKAVIDAIKVIEGAIGKATDSKQTYANNTRASFILEIYQLYGYNLLQFAKLAYKNQHLPFGALIRLGKAEAEKFYFETDDEILSEGKHAILIYGLERTAQKFKKIKDMFVEAQKFLDKLNKEQN